MASGEAGVGALGDADRKVLLTPLGTASCPGGGGKRRSCAGAFVVREPLPQSVCEGLEPASAAQLQGRWLEGFKAWAVARFSTAGSSSDSLCRGRWRRRQQPSALPVGVWVLSEESGLGGTRMLARDSLWSQLQAQRRRRRRRRRSRWRKLSQTPRRCLAPAPMSPRLEWSRRGLRAP